MSGAQASSQAPEHESGARSGIATGDHAAEPHVSTLAAASPSLWGKRVVVCEDEGVTQMQLRRALARAGLQVVGAAFNGQEGVEATLREKPDIVLMDIRMPIMDGLEASRRIMAEGNVCIVMLTAFSDSDVQAEARSIGVSGYIVKPITSDILLPQLQEAYQEFCRKNG